MGHRKYLQILDGPWNVPVSNITKACWNVDDTENYVWENLTVFKATKINSVMQSESNPTASTFQFHSSFQSTNGFSLFCLSFEALVPRVSFLMPVLLNHPSLDPCISPSTPKYMQKSLLLFVECWKCIEVTQTQRLEANSLKAVLKFMILCYINKQSWTAIIKTKSGHAAQTTISSKLVGTVMLCTTGTILVS